MRPRRPVSVSLPSVTTEDSFLLEPAGSVSSSKREIGPPARLLHSCRDRMEIITQSPEIIESKKTSAPTDPPQSPHDLSPVRKRRGMCLQNLVYEYGVEETHTPGKHLLS